MQQYHLPEKPHQYVPFPEVGSGGQFHVFDMHNGRVLKLPLTQSETEIIARQRYNTDGEGQKITDERIQARVLTFMNGKARIASMVQHDFLQPELFLHLLGSPTLIPVDNILPEDTPEKRWGAGRVVYTQDKLTMTSEVLNGLNNNLRISSSDVKRVRHIIDQYIERTYSLWEFGYADYVFKLGDTGFNERNQLTFADLGEFTSDLDFMATTVSQRRWLNNINPLKTDFPQIPRQAQEYFTSTVNNAFTLEELHKRWRTKHLCNDCRPKDDVLATFIAAKIAEIDFVDRW
jgi:hypothetical protein